MFTDKSNSFFNIAYCFECNENLLESDDAELLSVLSDDGKLICKSCSRDKKISKIIED